MPAGEGADRHQLHVRDAEGGEVPEAGRGRVEGALGGEGADVELVQDGVLEPGVRRRRPQRVERFEVDHRREAGAPAGASAVHQPSRSGSRAMSYVTSSSRMTT